MNDKDIREILCLYLETKHGKIRFFDELVIGKARADIVAVTDRLTGYEIKGDSDSYVRLPMQIKEYSKFFEENYIVIGSSHKRHAAEHIPDTWGILCISTEEDEPVIEQIRGPVKDKKFSWNRQLSLLWRSELSRILTCNHLPKYTNKSKAARAKILLEKVDSDTLRRQVCDELLERDYSRFLVRK